MRGTSKWAHRQQKRAQALAYGCYPPDADPNLNDLDRDANEVEAAAERERRRERRVIIDGIRESSKGYAMLGKWEYDGQPTRE